MSKFEVTQKHWSEVMGYRREDVIGQRLTAFFSAQSRRYAEEQVFQGGQRSGWPGEQWRYSKRGLGLVGTGRVIGRGGHVTVLIASTDADFNHA